MGSSGHMLIRWPMVKYSVSTKAWKQAKSWVIIHSSKPKGEWLSAEDGKALLPNPNGLHCDLSIGACQTLQTASLSATDDISIIRSITRGAWVCQKIKIRLMREGGRGGEAEWEREEEREEGERGKEKKEREKKKKKDRCQKGQVDDRDKKERWYREKQMTEREKTEKDYREIHSREKWMRERHEWQSKRDRWWISRWQREIDNSLFTNLFSHLLWQTPY